ncbi:hypothetical protein [Streptomyces cellostaticus]|uniref:hypothetical protein n=1 Tax=Streptomyces cellostaticus TaxID=67285 RepID=UPI0020264E64|nr:hypothetical protein [Streptomyces cellostaticus]
MLGPYSPGARSAEIQPPLPADRILAEGAVRSLGDEHEGEHADEHEAVLLVEAPGTARRRWSTAPGTGGRPAARTKPTTERTSRSPIRRPPGHPGTPGRRAAGRP